MSCNWNMLDTVGRYAEAYASVARGEREDSALPGKTWFIGHEEMLTLPHDDGDCRYPYGSNGFNFWAYASGYMHANEGLFSPLLRSAEGEEPNAAWFAGFPQGDTVEVVPLLGVPAADDEAVRYTVFNKSFITYITEIHGLRFAVRLVTTEQRELLMTVTAENLGTEERRFFLSSYFNPFLQHGVYPCGEDRWFREVTVRDCPGQVLPAFTVRCNISLSRTRQVVNLGTLTRALRCEGGAWLSGHEETASRYQYVGGVRGSLHRPGGLLRGRFEPPVHTATFTEVAACGDLLHVAVPAGGSVRTDTLFAYRVHRESEDELTEMLREVPSAETVDARVAEMVQAESSRNSGLAFRATGTYGERLTAEKLNQFVEQLKKQVEFCAMLKGYAQPGAGSLIGVRDVGQALEGYQIWRPAEARAKILELLSFTDPSGRCPRQYSLPAYEGAVPAMDLRPFIDQGVWVISTVVNYLKYTDDYSLLSESCGFYRIVDEAARQVEKCEEQSSVLDHLLRIMDWLMDKTDSETDCIRVLYGDWNDALDGLGVSQDPSKAYGSGVSVMAASQVWQNYREMSELLSRLDAEQYAGRIAEYGARADKLEKGLRRYGIQYNAEGQPRITHGWGDRRSYYVGSWKDPDGAARRSLTANAFWVLSGLYDRDMSLRQTIHDDILALDSPYGLKTFDPHFEPDAKGVGRIPKLPAGTAENGAPYIHASVFGVMALFRMGCAEDAWAELYKALPLTHDHVSVSPFVMPNSYGYNPAKHIDGESMMDWQTGSSNVMLKLLVRFVMGVRPEYDGVWIQPAASCPFEFTAHVPVKGADLRITYRRSGLGRRRYTVNGTERSGEYSDVLRTERLWLPAEQLKGTVEILAED